MATTTFVLVGTPYADCCPDCHPFLLLSPSPKSEADIVAATIQGYYDSDNVFNFYRQVRARGWGSCDG